VKKSNEVYILEIWRKKVLSLQNITFISENINGGRSWVDASEWLSTEGSSWMQVDIYK
jgi:hypothetical protein